MSEYLKINWINNEVYVPTSNTIQSVEKGGTGATSKEQARSNLDAASILTEGFTQLVGNNKTDITDLLHVNIYDVIDRTNFNCIIKTENISTLTNVPNIFSGQTHPFYAYRIVYPVLSTEADKSYHIIITLYEMYPYAGRIWMNVYNANFRNWQGWQQISGISQSNICNLIELQVYNPNGESAIGTYYETGKFYLTSNTQTKRRQLFDAIRGPIILLDENYTYMYTNFINDKQPATIDNLKTESLYSGRLSTDNSVIIPDGQKYQQLGIKYSTDNNVITADNSLKYTTIPITENLNNIMLTNEEENNIKIDLEKVNNSDIKVTITSNNKNAYVSNIDGLSNYK